MTKRPQQVSLFFDAAHSMSSELIDFLQSKSSASVHPTATIRYWMNKTNATIGNDKEELVHVAFLQLCGGDSAHL